MTTNPTYTSKLVTSEADLKLCFQVRHDVFVVEQQVPAENEYDEVDRAPDTLHFVAIEDGTGVPLGTCRVFPAAKPVHGLETVNGKVAKLGRMACTAPSRGRGVGKALCLLAHKTLAERGFKAVAIHAQLDKEGFYKKLGYFRTADEVFDEEGIDHIYMAVLL
ncbi:hypothetical protein GGF31_000266 [Allomyces arbusculus]|nr:hypothetical protein GGF31_000266 [Allomyces arbusculus]